MARQPSPLRRRTDALAVANFVAAEQECVALELLSNPLHHSLDSSLVEVRDKHQKLVPAHTPADVALPRIGAYDLREFF
jgi:hypothetical protein